MKKILIILFLLLVFNAYSQDYKGIANIKDNTDINIYDENGYKGETFNDILKEGFKLKANKTININFNDAKITILKDSIFIYKEDKNNKHVFEIKKGALKVANKKGKEQFVFLNKEKKITLDNTKDNIVGISYDNKAIYIEQGNIKVEQKKASYNLKQNDSLNSSNKIIKRHNDNKKDLAYIKHTFLDLNLKIKDDLQKVEFKITEAGCFFNSIINKNDKAKSKQYPNYTRFDYYIDNKNKCNHEFNIYPYFYDYVVADDTMPRQLAYNNSIYPRDIKTHQSEPYQSSRMTDLSITKYKDSELQDRKVGQNFYRTTRNFNYLNNKYIGAEKENEDPLRDDLIEDSYYAYSYYRNALNYKPLIQKKPVWIAWITSTESLVAFGNRQVFTLFALKPYYEKDDFKMQFYLPLTFRLDAFSAPYLFKDRGLSHQWSFGTDINNDNILDGSIADIIRDIFSKIYFLDYYSEYNPFYIHIGKIRNKTLAKGMFLNNYSNDADYEISKRTGMEIGYYNKYYNFELFIDDFALPNIINLENEYTPSLDYKATLGTGLLLDLDSSSYLAYDLDNTYIDPDLILNLGFTTFLNLPLIFNSKIFNLDLNVGASFYFPILGVQNQDDKNLVYRYEDGLYKKKGFSNYGVKLGIEGKSSLALNNIYSFKFDFYYSRGTFRPMYISPLYQKSGALKNTDIKYSKQYYYRELNNFGLYLEYNMNLKNTLLIHISYLLPMSLFPKLSPNDNINKDKGFLIGDGDMLRFIIETDPNFIPTGINFGFEYNKEYFINGILNKSFLDGYTALLLRVNFPLLKNLKLSISGGITSFYDSNGKFVFKDKKVFDYSPLLVIRLETGIFDKYIFDWKKVKD